MAKLNESTHVFRLFFQIRITGKLEYGAIIVVVKTSRNVGKTGVQSILRGGGNALGYAGVDNGPGRITQWLFPCIQLGFTLGKSDAGVPVTRACFPAVVKTGVAPGQVVNTGFWYRTTSGKSDKIRSVGSVGLVVDILVG